MARWASAPLVSDRSMVPLDRSHNWSRWLHSDQPLKEKSSGDGVK